MRIQFIHNLTVFGLLYVLGKYLDAINSEN